MLDDGGWKKIGPKLRVDIYILKDSVHKDTAFDHSSTFHCNFFRKKR
jgi:hypothetical protein